MPREFVDIQTFQMKNLQHYIEEATFQKRHFLKNAKDLDQRKGQQQQQQQQGKVGTNIPTAILRV